MSELHIGSPVAATPCAVEEQKPAQASLSTSTRDHYTSVDESIDATDDCPSNTSSSSDDDEEGDFYGDEPRSYLPTKSDCRSPYAIVEVALLQYLVERYGFSVMKYGMVVLPADSHAQHAVSAPLPCCGGPRTMCHI
jgi:hypothetical protein